MTRLWTLALAMLGTPALPALAQSDGYTLDQAVAAMRSAHPMVQAARASVDAALGDAVDAGLWTNPVLSGTWTQAIANSSYGRAGYTTFAIGQFLELSNAPGARRRAANLEVAASRSDLDAVVAQLALDLESAMIERTAAVESVRVLERIGAGLRDAQRIIETRVQAGASPRYDAARIAISLALVDADLASARADVSAADRACAPRSARASRACRASRAMIFSTRPTCRRSRS
jgi:outer membrane protein TolC